MLSIALPRNFVRVKKHLATRKTFGRPVGFTLVVLSDSRRALRQHDPGLLGAREDMNIGWQ